jgi:hypothetical protein
LNECQILGRSAAGTDLTLGARSWELVTNEDVNADIRTLDRCRSDWGCGTKRGQSRAGAREAGCPPIEPTMADDRDAKLSSGRMGIAAVVANVLTDKRRHQSRLRGLSSVHTRRRADVQPGGGSRSSCRTGSHLDGPAEYAGRNAKWAHRCGRHAHS